MKTTKGQNGPPATDPNEVYREQQRLALQVLADIPLERIACEPPAWAQTLLKTLRDRFAAAELLRFQTLKNEEMPREAMMSDRTLPVLLGRTDIQRSLLGKDYAAQPVSLERPARRLLNRYDFVGTLCSVAAMGGAYTTPLQPEGEKLLKAGFNFSKFFAPNDPMARHYASWYYAGAWCPWFADVVWDHTFLTVDRKNGKRISLLCITCDD